MHVAVFTETYFPQLNGVTYTLDAWREELTRQGHEVTIVYPESKHVPRRGEVPVRSLGFRPVQGYRVGVTRLGRLDEPVRDADLVHVHGPFTMGLQGQRFASRRDLPVVATHHTPAERYLRYLTSNRALQRALDRVYGRWERWFYGRCDLLLAPSPQAASHLEGRVGREVQPLSNGTDTTFFSPRVTDFRHRHGLGEGPLLGYCGRLGYEKNLEDLMALARVFRGQVVVAGDGFAKDHYVPRFEAAGIRYLGRLPRWEMPEFYSSLDLFVLPSTEETQGVSVLEANACGTPAVGADAGGLRDTIRDKVNGARYPPGDVAALHAVVEACLADRESLGVGAREHALDHDVAKVVDRLEVLYGEVLSPGGEKMLSETWERATPAMTNPPP